MYTRAAEEAVPSEQVLNSGHRLLLKRLVSCNTQVLRGADNTVIREIVKLISFMEEISATVKGLELDDDAQAIIAAIRSVWTEWQAKYRQSDLGNTQV